jgi:zinc/manganese transport system substrate-binding protein
MYSKLMFRLAALLLAVLALPAAAALNVFATVPEWAALAKEIGGDGSRSSPPPMPCRTPSHRGQALADRPRPGSQLVVATGADLEIGWLPVVLRGRAMPPSSPGSRATSRPPGGPPARVPARLDRADGDVHPGGTSRPIRATS